MKILESQNAVLSNYEVYQHLVDHQKNLKQKQRKGPGNLATLIKEVLAYLKTAPSPLAKQEETRHYDAEVVTRLLEGLSNANLNQDLAKGEVLMILNLRPSTIAVLSTVIEDMEDRFSDDEQAAILEVIADVLGRDESHADAGGEEAMESVEGGA
ncbi:RNA polymerase Rpb4-domain-containing protein [Coniochaeta sp. 2T2.1]|nr:RNA polymerase Rpb4-domain-containing protein [Coniochaeta sp. 2T2.1]